MLKVSIITASYNNAKTVSDTIQSVRNQLYPEIEHIIIDGKSSDQTPQIISEAVAQNNSRITRFVSEHDEGIYDAMNKGIALVTGDVIGILNADDFYSSNDIISEILKTMECGQFDAIYGDLAYVNCDDITKVVRFWKAGNYVPGAFSKGWVPPHPTFFCRRCLYTRYGNFLKNMKIAADFELMLRFIERHKIKVGYLPRVIVKMRIGGKAYGWKGRIRGNIEILQSFKLNSLKLSPWFFINKPLAKIMQIVKKRIATD
ncbi:MAG: glycosyl transferase [Planctomycetes bacterium GWF2_41_51]|nr:MAG: glycosyl transferase [Planctomycetes bacterium GWF2_41_51]HBG27242.1 glycosyl transferase [Phycisphaerales bacterium]